MYTEDVGELTREMPYTFLNISGDSFTAEVSYRIEPGEPYFQDLRERWSVALRAAHTAIPRPPYRGPAE